MSTQNQSIITAVNTALLELLQSQPERVSIESLITLVKAESFQVKLSDAVSSAIPKQPKTVKKLKDPDAPKRPKTAYLLFCEENRKSLSDEFKGKAVMTELGRLWNELSEKKKAPYTKAAEQEKTRYRAEMDDYKRPSEEQLAQLPVNQPKKGRRTSSEPKSGAKRAPTSFLLFASEMRQGVKDRNPEFSPQEISKELGRMWKEDYADDESREKWVSAAAEAKAKMGSTQRSQSKPKINPKREGKKSDSESDSDSDDD